MTTLPEGWSTRRPKLDDAAEILALVHACDMASIGEPDYTLDEVREMLTEPNTDMARDCWLALDDEGRIVGWAYPRNANGGSRDFADVYTWPERGTPALRPLLALLMGRMSERAARFGHDPYEVRAGAIPTEQDLIDALTEAGFVFLKQHARMQMSLDGVPLTAPEPPPGVTVREVRGDDEDDMRAVHSVIFQAFADTDHTSNDYDSWRTQLSNEKSLSFDEWFAAEADGRVVGALQSSDAGLDDNEGWVKRLGVLRPYRKRGVGEALLRRAFAVYAGKGRTKAGLGVDLANPTQAARLYYAVGMTPQYRANVYRTYVPARAR
ncbi:GNAT family N-acetyltransferase [Actinoplanes sp. NPDC026619]|uniref:GNAT family N-acetyltransferase n=1 Tax=Actinoplanes sp. NPDC026619 TaxID=3155798 RepID=UPI00340DAE97